MSNAAAKKPLTKKSLRRVESLLCQAECARASRTSDFCWTEIFVEACDRLGVSFDIRDRAAAIESLRWALYAARSLRVSVDMFGGAS